jgi:hypothetical protein
MQSRTYAGDEANGSFGAAESELQAVKLGVESKTAARQEAAESAHRRSPGEGKSIDRAPLARRMQAARKGK